MDNHVKIRVVCKYGLFAFLKHSHIHSENNGY